MNDDDRRLLGNLRQPGSHRSGPRAAAGNDELRARMARCVIDCARWDDDDYPVGGGASYVHRPLDDESTTDALELLRAAETTTFSSGDDDRPDAVTHGGLRSD